MNSFLHRISNYISLVTAVAWVAALSYSTSVARVLYGDGSYALLLLLSEPNRFFDYDAHRTYASLISQAPILFGQRFGFDTVTGYASLFSFGIFGIPALLLLFALFLSRKQRLLFASIGFAILVYGFGVNFIGSETNLYFGLVWLAVTILALRETAPIMRGIVLPMIGVILLRTYEGMLLVGPFLALWAIVAARRSNDDLSRIGLVIAALMFILGSVIGLGGFLAPRDVGNASNFINSAFKYFQSPQMAIFVSGMIATVGMNLARGRAYLACAVGSALVGLVFVMWIVNIDGYYSFNFYYLNRSFLVLILPVFVGALLLAYWFRPALLLAEPSESSYLIFLIPLFFVVVGDGIGSYSWASYVNVFCETLETDRLPQQRVAALKNSGVRTAWSWAHPSMSILLRDRGSKAMVVNYPGDFEWEPFKPENPPSHSYRGVCESPLLGRARPESFRVPISFIGAANYPSYIKSVTGLSKPEGWATWSEGELVTFHFSQKLPTSFDLKLRIWSAIGSNKVMPIKVQSGIQELEFVVDREPTDVTLHFREIGDAETLEVHIPKPEQPIQSVFGSDPRMLGIAFVSMTITPT